MVIKDKIKDAYISGLSIAEVAKKFKISCSGARYILLKGGVAMRSRSNAVRIKHHKKLNSFSCSIVKKIPKELNTLYIAGLALYWGEGSKSGNTIAIANSDPALIVMFLTFLRKICKVDETRLHILVHYYSDQKEKDLINFWSKITKINRSQFYISTLHKEKTKHSTKRLKFGTISLRYADSLLFKEILERINTIKIK